MAKIDPKELFKLGARYLREHPDVLRRVAFNAVLLRVTIPLDVFRYFAETFGKDNKKAPKDVVVEAQPPAIKIGASVSAMGTPIRFAAAIRVDEVGLGAQELRFALTLSDVSLKLEGKSDSPVAALIQSGALDLSKPGNLAKFMPNRPPALVEAEDDRIVVDLMRDEKIAKNPKVRRILDLVVPILAIKSVRTEHDALVIALRAIPSGVPAVVGHLRHT